MEEKKELSIGISKYARNNTIEHLKQAFINDMLEQEDFEQRLSIATSTRDKADLKELIADLPEMNSIQPQQQTSTIPESKPEMITILSESKRKGVWKPPRKMMIKSILGENTLDFTKAEMPDGVTEIDITCVLGEVKIYVPDWIKVQGHCRAILGSYTDRSKNCEKPNAPVLRIGGYTVLGSIEILPPKVGILKKILDKFGLDMDING